MSRGALTCAMGIVLAGLAATGPPAAGKGLELSLRADVPRPAVGQRVEIMLTGDADPELTQPCRRMRVVVVGPEVSVKRALRSLEGRADSRRIGRWGAFRLASLRSVGELRWTGALRPNRPGRWTLVVPNRCAAGYVLPEGVERLHLDVRTPGAGAAGRMAVRVAVPFVVGLRRTEAQCVLRARGLAWRFGMRPAVHRVPALPCDQLEHVKVAPDPDVLAQHPEPGIRVPPGSAVALEDECTRSLEAGGPPCL